MAISLATLVARLQADVPAVDGVPTTDQYERAVAEAVADYSRRQPVHRSFTLSVQSGTDEYALPDDFLFVIELTSAYDETDVLVTQAGLVPMAADFEERLTVQGHTLVIYPEPDYTLDRLLWYGAGHVISGDEYPYLEEADTTILMLRAQAMALGAQANQAAHSAWSYQLGDERVDKKGQAAGLRGQADNLMLQYESAVRASVGPVTLIRGL